MADSDSLTLIHPGPKTLEIDHLNQLPDDILLLILDKIGDVKALGRCCMISRRFNSLVPQVKNVTVHVDCVISNDIFSYPSAASGPHIFVDDINIIKRGSSSSSCSSSGEIVKHYSLTEVLKKFEKIKDLHIELPNGEDFMLDNTNLLKWRAEYGSTLVNYVAFKASTAESNENIPESLETSVVFKLVLDSLKAGLRRHRLAQSIIANHKTLERLIITDANSQGVFSMNKNQLEEVKKNSRVSVIVLSRRQLYAPILELPDGTVLKGVTLLSIRTDGKSTKDKVSDFSWVISTLEEPYRTAAKLLVNQKVKEEEK